MVHDGEVRVSLHHVEYRIWNSGVLCLVGLEDHQEAFLVRSDQSAEASDLLQGVMLVEVCQFQGPYERGQAFGSESMRSSSVEPT